MDAATELPARQLGAVLRQALLAWLRADAASGAPRAVPASSACALEAATAFGDESSELQPRFSCAFDGRK